MKVERSYNYDTRTLATWCYNKILEGSGSYYSIFRDFSKDKSLGEALKELMEVKDILFCDSSIKVSLIKKTILYVLEASPDKKALSREDIINTIINSLIVSPQVIERPTRSGRRSNLESEIGWEIYHLVKEGRIEKVSKGYYKAV